MIHIVTSRLQGDKHDWTLIRGGKYKCALCGYTLTAEDALIFSSGCPQSKVVLAEALKGA